MTTSETARAAARAVCEECGLPIDEHGAWTWERLVTTELAAKARRRGAR